MRQLGLLLLAWVTGCSAIVGGPAAPFEDVPCELIDGVVDPCGAGRECLEGRCQMVADLCDGIDNDLDTNVDEGGAGRPACTEVGEICVAGVCEPGMPEICNDLDDDHDEMIDEGLDVDLDGDLYTTCAADPLLRDCVDRPGVGELINPGAPEVCDGYDNDCDPSTPDPGCEAEQVCATPIGGDRPTCLDRMSCRLTGCPTGARCDGSSDRCAAISDCRVPGMECPVGQNCEVPIEGGLPVCVTAPPGPIGTACTADEQCGSGLCVPFSALALASTRPGALGICGAPCCVHTDCAVHGADLACLAPGTGARSCVPRAVAGDAAEVPLCTSDTCSSATCRLSSASTGAASPLFDVFACGPAVGTGDGFCIDDSDCETGICNNFVCRYPCGSGADCSVIGCAYVSSGSADWVTVCGVYGTAATGASCTRNGDCREGYCDPDSGVCRATCCRDATCGDGLRCAPVDNAGWEMRCMPEAPPG